MSRILCVLLLLAWVVTGQEIARFELSASYSLINIDMNQLTPRQMMSGGELGFAVNANQYFAFEGEVAGYYKPHVLGTDVDATAFAVLEGPRLNLRPVFLRALVGADRLTGYGYGGSASQYSFAAIAGVGARFELSRRWAIRSGLDYVLTWHNILGGPRVKQNNFRLGLGVVYQFGAPLGRGPACVGKS